MREQLKQRLGRRGRFTASFRRFGIKRNQFGVVKTALFLDIRDESNALITDHLWFKVGKQWHELQLAQGDRVEFYATVSEYKKVDALDDDDVGHLRRRVVDYCLARPSHVRKLGVEKPAPLFEGVCSED